MSAQKKIIDIHENRCHLICIKDSNDKTHPYHVYMVISPTGSPLRKRLLVKYTDFMSVLYFFRDFFLYGLDVCCLTEIKEWLAEHSA